MESRRGYRLSKDNLLPERLLYALKRAPLFGPLKNQPDNRPYPNEWTDWQNLTAR
jgi:hypothetical protein